MSKGLLFWILMLLWLLSGVYVAFATDPLKIAVVGWGWLPYVLFALLGWKCYGPPIKE